MLLNSYHGDIVPLNSYHGGIIINIIIGSLFKCWCGRSMSSDSSDSESEKSSLKSEGRVWSSLLFVFRQGLRQAIWISSRGLGRPPVRIRGWPNTGL